MVDHRCGDKEGMYVSTYHVSYAFCDDSCKHENRSETQGSYEVSYVCCNEENKYKNKMSRIARKHACSVDDCKHRYKYRVKYR